MRAFRPSLAVLALATAVACAFAVSPARAQCTEGDQAFPAKEGWEPTRPITRLILLEAKGCLGGENDQSPVAVAVRKALDVPPDDHELFGPATKAALLLIERHLQQPVAAAPPDVRGDALRDLVRQVAGARALLGTRVSPALPESWVYDDGRIFAIARPLRGDLDAACSEPDAGCVAAFGTMRDVLRHANLVHRALAKSESPIMVELLAANVRREKSWDDYFERARSQYVWELALNGALVKDTRPEVAPGVRGGFRDVPSSQVMFLHPYVAMEYASAEAEGNRFNGAVLVDLLGYNRWSWRKDGSMGFALGASFVLSASDHAATDDVALGFMVHVNHQWSIGMVFGGGDPTLMVSGDVAQLWTKVSSATKGRLMTGK